MPYSKAALQALGSGDLTNSPASSSCRLTLFLEHHVRIAAVNLCISIYAQEPCIDIGTKSFKEAFYMHFDAKLEDAGRVDSICDEKH